MFRSLRRSLSRLTAAGFALACASSAFALPVTLSAGQSAGFNFNFVGESPAPPYETLRTDFGFSDTGAGDQWVLTWYEEHDLLGANARDYGFAGAITSYSEPFSNNAISQGIIDGIFSVEVRVTSGSITLDSLTSIGFNAAGDDTGNQLPAPVATTPNRAPEPTTGALAVLALATAGALSRRRRAA